MYQTENVRVWDVDSWPIKVAHQVQSYLVTRPVNDLDSWAFKGHTECTRGQRREFFCSSRLRRLLASSLSMSTCARNMAFSRSSRDARYAISSSLRLRASRDFLAARLLRFRRSKYLSSLASSGMGFFSLRGRRCVCVNAIACATALDEPAMTTPTFCLKAYFHLTMHCGMEASQQTSSESEKGEDVLLKAVFTYRIFSFFLFDKEKKKFKRQKSREGIRGKAFRLSVWKHLRDEKRDSCWKMNTQLATGWEKLHKLVSKSKDLRCAHDA